MTYEEKRYGKKVEGIPADAQRVGTASGYIRCGEVYARRKKDGTYYHAHLVGGSNRGAWGYHLVYFLAD